MKVKANVKVGKIAVNHNQTAAKSLKIKSNIKAGGSRYQHNQTLVMANRLQHPTDSLRLLFEAARSRDDLGGFCLVGQGSHKYEGRAQCPDLSLLLPYTTGNQ